MSDEQNIKNNSGKCENKLIIVLLSISLVFSMLTFGLSAFNTAIIIGAATPQNQHGKILISKKYDKGQSLEKAYKKKKPVVVFFYADWCGYCQRFAPTFDAITKDRQIKKKFAVAYVNCDKPENRALVEQFQIKGFPTVYVIKDENNKVQLSNSTFFNSDSKNVVKADMLKFLEEN